MGFSRGWHERRRARTRRLGLCMNECGQPRGTTLLCERCRARKAETYQRTKRPHPLWLDADTAEGPFMLIQWRVERNERHRPTGAAYARRVYRARRAKYIERLRSDPAFHAEEMAQWRLKARLRRLASPPTQEQRRKWNAATREYNEKNPRNYLGNWARNHKVSMATALEMAPMLLAARELRKELNQAKGKTK